MGKKRGRKLGNREGSISWDEKRKAYRVRLQMADGKTANRYTRRNAPRYEAEEIRRELHAQKKRGAPLHDESTTGQYLKEWLDSASTSVAESTHRRYTIYVEQHILPEIGTVPLKDLKPAHIEVLKNSLLRKLKASTVKQALVVLSVALNQAVKWELIGRNPAEAVRRPKTPSKPMRALTEGEASALISHVRETRYEALYSVAIKTGMRIGEITALRWEDLEGGALKVTRSVRFTKDGPIFGETKGRESRSIALGPKLTDTLESHRKLQLEERMVYPGKWQYPELVFPSENGLVLRDSTALVKLKRHLREAGIREVRFHDLRHTAATLMRRSGIPLETVSKLLGHKDSAITVRMYSHVLPDMESEAAEKIENWSF